MLGFGPLLGVTLVWLGLRHRQAYRELRTAMLASLALAGMAIALFGYALVSCRSIQFLPGAFSRRLHLGSGRCSTASAV